MSLALSTPYDRIEDPPALADLIFPMPKGAHINGVPYVAPQPFGQGGSSRGSTRLANALRCPLKAALAMAKPRPSVFTEAPVVLGTMFHILAADAGVNEAHRVYGDPLPSWATLPMSERLMKVRGSTTALAEEAKMLFDSVWPTIKKMMPIRGLGFEHEIAATIGELWPDAPLSESMKLEVVTAQVDIIPFLGHSKRGRPVITLEDYKTRGYLAKAKPQDSIDWQAALYRRIAEVRLAAEVAGFVHVLVQRGSDTKVERRAVNTPPLMLKDLGRIVTSAIKREHRIIELIQQKRRPPAFGMATGFCFGTYATWPCEYQNLCMAHSPEQRESVKTAMFS